MDENIADPRQSRHQDSHENKMEAEGESLELKTSSVSLPMTPRSSGIVLGPDSSNSEFESKTESGFEGAVKIGNNLHLIDPVVDWKCTSEPMMEALGIELIVKKIFLHMDFETLKIARCVSRHWAHLASKELQKRSTVYLEYSLCYETSPCSITYKTLDELVELLETKAAVDSNFGSTFEFPSSSFEFYDSEMMSNWLYTDSEKIQRFLSLNGTRITKLMFEIHFVPDWNKEKVLSQLKTLIHHVPCLTTLELLATSDFEGLGVFKLFDQSDEHSVKLLPCLRVLKMPFSCHRGIFEEISNEAPNLQEIVLSLKYVPFLFERPNQLQLLKETHAFSFSEEDEVFIEIMTVLGSGKHGTLRLREFVFGFPLKHDLPIWPTMRDALNCMLTSPYVTIETLQFDADPDHFRIEIPSSMFPCERRSRKDFRFKRMNTDPKEIPQSSGC